jgi:tRNA 2-thiouridine synthesizing protein A
MNKLRIADNEIYASAVLDTKGLFCPMPLYQTKKELCKLVSGQILQVDGTDPGIQSDLSGWCERSGNKYLGEKERQGYLSFFIRKG